MAVAAHTRLLGGFVYAALADRAIFRAEQKRDGLFAEWEIVPVPLDRDLGGLLRGQRLAVGVPFHQRLGADRDAPGGLADALEFHRAVPVQVQDGAAAEDFQHPVLEGRLLFDAGGLKLGAGVDGGGDAGLEGEWAHTRVMLGVCSGRSTSTSSSGGSLLAIDLRVTCGTMPPISSPRVFCLRL